MNGNEESVRVKQLDELLPEYIKDGSYSNLLYVGGHLRYGRNMQTCDYWLNCGYKIDVIEVFPENIKQLQGLEWINRLIEGDIRLFKPYGVYDLVVWWHGPEHLKKGEAKDILKAMRGYSEAIVWAAPNGEYKQGPEYGNEHERHLSTWRAEDFRNLNMLASEIGVPDGKNGNIVGFWDKYMGYE